MGWEHHNYMHTLDTQEEEEAAHYSTVGNISYYTVCSAEIDSTFHLKTSPVSVLECVLLMPRLQGTLLQFNN